MNLALTGFMGAGKTTVGRRLAQLLKLRFVDIDAEIEREHGPIVAVFATEGEARFRHYETEALTRATSGGPYVIAVGGGAVLEPANRHLLRRSGLIVHLAISPKAALARVARRSHRPLLGPKPDLQSIQRLLAARKDAYADCDLMVSVDGRSAAAIAAIIARWYARQIDKPA